VCPHCGRDTSRLLAFGKAAQSCGCSMILLGILIPVLVVIGFFLYAMFLSSTPAP
jgi:hypothetical protein